MPEYTTNGAKERKRQLDRERIAAKRAALTPEERAAKRRAHDAAYRRAHRQAGSR